MDSSKQEKIRLAIEQAPPLSPNASQLLQTVVDPEHELFDVVNIVKHDSLLTARLLRIVNSPVYGLLKQVKSVERAITYLGERIVVSVTIADSIPKLLDKPLSGYNSKQGDLWRHDLFAAFAAREVSRLFRDNIDAELAFTGGLLHDIGKAIISDFLEEDLERAITDIEKGEFADYLGAEKKMLGLDHAEVGYKLAQIWNLPEPFPQMIQYHHDPERADENLRPLVYAVHLGDLIAMMGGCGTGSDTLRYRLLAEYTKYFDISSNALAHVMLVARDEFQKVLACHVM